MLLVLWGAVILVALGLFGYSLAIKVKRLPKAPAPAPQLPATPPPATPAPPPPPTRTAPRENRRIVPRIYPSPFASISRVGQDIENLARSLRPNYPSSSASVARAGQELENLARALEPTFQQLSLDVSYGEGTQVFRDAHGLASYGVTPDLIVGNTRTECIANLRGYLGVLSEQQVAELGTARDIEDWPMLVQSLLAAMGMEPPMQQQQRAQPRARNTQPQAQQQPQPTSDPAKDEKIPSRFEREDPI